MRRAGDRPFRDHGWHFDKRLSVDTLVAVVGVAIVIGGPILIWGRAMETRVQALEVVQEQRSKMELQRDADIREQRNALIARLDKFEEQVTQLRVAIGALGSRMDGKGQSR